MTKQERLKNKSVEAIVKLYDGIARNLMDKTNVVHERTGQE